MRLSNIPIHPLSLSWQTRHSSLRCIIAGLRHRRSKSWSCGPRGLGQYRFSNSVVPSLRTQIPGLLGVCYLAVENKARACHGRVLGFEWIWGARTLGPSNVLKPHRLPGTVMHDGWTLVLGRLSPGLSLHLRLKRAERSKATCNAKRARDWRLLSSSILEVVAERRMHLVAIDSTCKYQKTRLPTTWIPVLGEHSPTP